MISGAEINIVYYLYVKTQINPYSFHYSVQNKYMCILFEELVLPKSWNFMTKHVPVYDEDNRSSLFKQRIDSLNIFFKIFIMKADKFLIIYTMIADKLFCFESQWYRRLSQTIKTQYWKCIRQLNQGFPTLARFMQFYSQGMDLQILKEGVSSSYSAKSTF